MFILFTCRSSYSPSPLYLLKTLCLNDQIMNSGKHFISSNGVRQRLIVVFEVVASFLSLNLIFNLEMGTATSSKIFCHQICSPIHPNFLCKVGLNLTSSLVIPVAVIRLLDRDLYSVGLGEGPWALVTPWTWNSSCNHTTSSLCYKINFGANLDFPKIKKLKKFALMSEPLLKCENNAIFKQSKTPKLFLAFKIADSCCFS